MTDVKIIKSISIVFKKEDFEKIREKGVKKAPTLRRVARLWLEKSKTLKGKAEVAKVIEKYNYSWGENPAVMIGRTVGITQETMDDVTTIAEAFDVKKSDVVRAILLNAVDTKVNLLKNKED